MKKILNFIKKYKYIFISGLLGAISFIYIYGIDILNPTNVEWILANGGDITQHYLGWEFFRDSAWTFPIGMNSMSAYPFEFSVIFTDSIPIFALFFKLFSNLLPEYFQYIGIYGLLCFILQGVTASIILKKFIKNDYLNSFLSLFFIFSFVFIDRMFHHTALISNYLILLGFILVLYKDKFNLKSVTLYWGLLGALCASIHMYNLLFNGIILIGYVLYEFLSSKDIKRAILPFISYIVSALIIFFILGGFSSPASPLGVHALGLFSFNLNGFINPMGLSKIVPSLPKVTDLVQEEGFSYLGLGLIIAFIFAMIISISIFAYKIVMKKKIKFDKKLLISIIVVSFISLVASTASCVYFNDILLFDYDIPLFIESIVGVFRSNGRIIWIVYYMVIFMVIYVLYNALHRKPFIILMIILFVIQMCDLNHLINIRRGFIELEYNPILTDERWDKLFSEDFKNVILPNDFPGSLDTMYNIDLYALKYGKTINRFNIAQDFLNGIVDEQVKETMNTFDDNNLYIIDPFAYFKYDDLGINYYMLDGLYIATTKEISYLDKVIIDDLVIETKQDYSKFQFEEDKKYELFITSDDPLVPGDLIIEGMDKIPFVDENTLYISIENMNEIVINIYDGSTVKFTLKEVEEFSY